MDRYTTVSYQILHHNLWISNVYVIRNNGDKWDPIFEIRIKGYLNSVPLKCLSLFILASKIPPLNFILFSKCQFFDNSATIFYHPFSIHPLSILVDIYLFQRISYICSVFPIKFEKNDTFKRPRKSYRFRGLFWLIFGLLHDLFQVKCSKERIEILPEYVQNYQFKSLSYVPCAAGPIFQRMIKRI